MIQQDVPASTLEVKETSINAQNATPEKGSPRFEKGPRFWAILFVLALASLLTSLEATVTSTVMPSIVADLGGGDNYIWISNSYFLTMQVLPASHDSHQAVSSYGYVFLLNYLPWRLTKSGF